jgi:hypothetical protein
MTTPYNLSFAFELSGAGLALVGQLFDYSANPAGGAIYTGFFDQGGGWYSLDCQIPDVTFRGSLRVSLVPTTTLPPTTTKAPGTTATSTTTKAPTTTTPAPTLPPTTTAAPRTTTTPGPVFLPAVYVAPINPAEAGVPAPNPPIGAVLVNQDYGGPMALTYQTTGGQYIAGATISAYLTSDYLAGRTQATFLLGQSVTTATGTWSQPMYLAPNNVTLVFELPGQFGPNAVPIVVALS